ncbi:hypothetical protein MtrunA17_Chr8g0391501 [Medicago truncatula]|uniref:Uncharacterized protein n=1 Tax=Medicago truncatula TaxID=3880 RepID=A0A396GWA5_MEDTR|nr:hypothetical protein MtrunA17_Chr8g0391501 [Medicago truncatula]
MTKMFRWSARITFTAWPRFVFPINVHQKKEAKRNHREKRFEKILGNSDESLAKSVEAGDCEKKHHYRFCCCGIT